MQIIRVELNNYRSHINGDFSFDRGINLLIGRNGAGKSSILEAAGLALFDADVRSTISDAVARGYSTATIRVHFLANEGNEYIVERRIGTGARFRLFVSGEKTPRTEGKDAVLNKIKELSGIEINEKNIFQNVITAYQNRIVDIFSDRPAEREKTFNQIFDTAVYRQMFDGFTKEAVERYKKDIDIQKNLLNHISAQIKDPAIIKEDLNQRITLQKQTDEKLEGCNEKLKKADALRKEQEKVKKDIESAQNQMGYTLRIKQTRQRAKTDAEANLGRAQDAAKIVAENMATHTTYTETEEKAQAVSAQIETLEKKQTELDSCKEKKGVIIIELKTSEQKIQNISSINSDKKKEAEKFSIEAQDLKKEFEDISKRLDALEEAHNQKTVIQKSFNEELGNLKANQDRIKLLKNSLSGLQNQRVDLNVLHEQKKIKEEERKRLIKNRSERQNLENRLNQSLTRLSELKKAQKSLSDGLCPLLQEECLNLKHGTTPGIYFDSRKQQLDAEIKQIKNAMAAFKDIDRQISQIDGIMANIHQEIEKDASAEKEISSLSNQIALLDKEIKLSVSALRQKAQPAAAEDESMNAALAIDDFELVQIKLSDSTTALREQVNHQKILLDAADKKLTKNSRESDAITKQITGNETKQKQIEEKIKDNEIRLERLEEKTRLITEEIKHLELFRQNRKELTAALAGLRPGYELYMGNLKKSKELDACKKNLLEVENELKKISNEEDVLKDRLEKLIPQFSDDTYNRTIEETEKQAGEKEQLQERLSGIQTEIKLLKHELEENRKKQKQTEEINSRLNLLNKKCELAKKFRENLSSMGRFVAARLMQAIETAATDNFRKITGRAEQIRWINNEKESYSIFLTAGQDIEKQKRFEMLSGGEQVAVALSVRAAMASALTRANFAIFDEPTINLDSEKKIALAESLKEMLKNLNQAIIVTHDETFTEMAQKIICLD